MNQICCVCIHTLTDPRVCLLGCTHGLHQDCYASFRARETGPTADCPLCRAPTTLVKADGQVLPNNGEEVMSTAMGIARRAMTVDEHGDPSTWRANGLSSGNRIIYSSCHE